MKRPTCLYCQKKLGAHFRSIKELRVSKASTAPCYRQAVLGVGPNSRCGGAFLLDASDENWQVCQKCGDRQPSVCTDTFRKEPDGFGPYGDSLFCSLSHGHAWAVWMVNNGKAKPVQLVAAAPSGEGRK